MKMKNIPPDIKSKSINDAKSEIQDILERLEKDKADLEGSTKDYQHDRLKAKASRSPALNLQDWRCPFLISQEYLLFLILHRLLIYF